MKEGEEPIAAAVPPESIDLGKIQWQVVRQDTVLDLGLGPWRSLHGSSTVPARRDAGARRIMVDLRRLDPEHVQHHLGILWIVLVPAVVQRFSCSGQRQRRHQPHLETRFSQAPCYRPVSRSLQRRRPQGGRTPAALRSYGRAQHRVLRTKRRRRRLWPGASIRTSLRTLAMSIATSTAAAGVESEVVMVGLSGMGCEHSTF